MSEGTDEQTDIRASEGTNEQVSECVGLCVSVPRSLTCQTIDDIHALYSKHCDSVGCPSVDEHYSWADPGPQTVLEWLTTFFVATDGGGDEMGSARMV